MSQEPKVNLPKISEASPPPREAGRAIEAIEPRESARLNEIESLMREVLRERRDETRSPVKSRLALVAFVLAAAAFVCSAGQIYYSWSASSGISDSTRESVDQANTEPVGTDSDLRTQVTIPELARRGPSLRTGTLQAWWAGEQARQVQRLEAQAKRQTLAGDREGAARSASRADAIRGSIPVLADFEKPATR